MDKRETRITENESKAEEILNESYRERDKMIMARFDVEKRGLEMKDDIKKQVKEQTDIERRSIQDDFDKRFNVYRLGFFGMLGYCIFSSVLDVWYSDTLKSQFVALFGGIGTGVHEALQTAAEWLSNALNASYTIGYVITVVLTAAVLLFALYRAWKGITLVWRQLVTLRNVAVLAALLTLLTTIPELLAMLPVNSILLVLVLYLAYLAPQIPGAVKKAKHDKEYITID